MTAKDEQLELWPSDNDEGEEVYVYFFADSVLKCAIWDEGMTKRDFAEKLGVDLRFIDKEQTDEMKVTLQDLIKIFGNLTVGVIIVDKDDE